MMNFTDRGREIAILAAPRIGAVQSTADDRLQAFTWRCPQWPRASDAVNGYLRQLQSSDARPSTLRSYAYDVQRWLRFLRSINVEFDEASPVNYYDFRTFLRHHGKDHGARRSRGPQFAQRNFTTGRVHADNTEFGLATLQHSRTVLHEWYEFLHDVTGAPATNPIPHSYRRERGHQRIHEHHNPMQDFTTHRTRLREGGRRIPTTQPRSMTNDAFDDFWKAVTCHRDRALVKVHVDTAIRPSELLALTAGDVDWGGPTITVTRKGTRARQILPLSPEALDWLGRYLMEADYAPRPDQPLWVTRRKPRRPLAYDAYRLVFHRVNAVLQTDWTPHDLRHTGLSRMLAAGMPARYVQEIAGHASPHTLTRYTRPHLEEIIAAQAAARSRPEPPSTPSAYDPQDLQTLFGGR